MSERNNEVSSSKANIINNKYDFIIIFDVSWGNPNGTPNGGNMPRVDNETQFGLVSDVCIKRKIRNYIELVKDDSTGYRIYVKENSILNKQDEAALIGLNLTSGDIKKIKKDNEKKYNDMIRGWMCDNYYDVRTFGSVMTTFTRAPFNCGQVRGPVQIDFSESVEPIAPQQMTITRVARTVEEESKKNNQMGGKWVVPYGLYRCEGHVSANFAKKSGFTEDDLELLWDAIYNMFEDDRSASRGKMVMRKLIIFKHDSAFGNAPAHKLFDLVSIKRKDPDASAPARAYDDYDVCIDEDKLPEGVTLSVRE